MNAIADGYYETDLHGGLRAANASLCHIFNADDPAALGGDAFIEQLDKVSAHHLRAAFRQVVETGEAIPNLECHITEASGEQRTLEFSVAAVRDAGGAMIGFQGIVRDMTDRRRAERLLNQRVSVLAVLQQVDVELNQNLTLDSVLAVALNAAVLLSSADAGFIGLIERDSIRLARSVGGFTEQWMALDKGIISRVMRLQRAERVTDVTTDPDYYPDLPDTRAEIAIPLVAHNKLLGVLNLETATPECFTPQVFEIVQILAARVATAVENARLHEAMQTQLDELGALYAQVSNLEQLKTDTIRVAAHDLRGPLAIIGSYTELLYEDLAPYLDDTHLLYIDAMRQALARMTQMTTDILSLERLEIERDATPTRVHLSVLLDHAMREFSDRCHQRSLHVEVTAEQVSVYGDSTELYEAITNLLSNAVKYTADGGSIQARIRREHDDAVLEIEDTGCGIPEADMGDLFKPFHRIKLPETQLVDGTGLGLYLVKKIIERHNGTVFVRSVYGKGSAFGFRIPLAPNSDGSA